LEVKEWLFIYFFLFLGTVEIDFNVKDAMTNGPISGGRRSRNIEEERQYPMYMWVEKIIKKYSLFLRQCKVYQPARSQGRKKQKKKKKKKNERQL